MRRRTFLAAATVGAMCGASGCASSILRRRTPAIGWSYETKGLVETRVEDDHVFVLGRSKLHAVTRTDGTRAWTRRVSKPSGMELDGNNVYVYGEQELAAIERASGTKRWHSSGSYQSVFRGTDVVVGYKWNGDETFAFDPETGDQKWKWSGNMLVERTPDTAITYRDRLTGVDLASGEKRWTFQKGPEGPDVGYAGNRLYVGFETEGDTYTLHAVDPATGSVRWRQSVREGYFGRARLLDGTLFVSWRMENPDSGFVAAHDPDSGSVRWKAEPIAEQPTPYPTTVKNGTLLVSESMWDGVLPDLSALDVRTGERKWQRTDADVVSATDDRVVLEQKQGRFRGLDFAGNEQWSTQMEVVPMAGSGGNDPVYRRPEVVSTKSTFAAGFSGTNLLSEWSATTGGRTWQLNLDDVFGTLQTDGESLFVTTDKKLIQVRIDE